jgi:hypothetical protein
MFTLYVTSFLAVRNREYRILRRLLGEKHLDFHPDWTYFPQACYMPVIRVSSSAPAFGQGKGFGRIAGRVVQHAHTGVH